MQKLKQGAPGMPLEEAGRPWIMLLDSLESIGSKAQNNEEMALAERYLKVSMPVDSRVTCTIFDELSRCSPCISDRASGERPAGM